MKNLTTPIITAVIAIAAAYITVQSSLPDDFKPAETSENIAFERVQETRTIRCAYGLWDPVVMRDANTGEMSGLMVDIMAAIGKAAGYDIEWTQEVEWGNVPEELKSQKADAHCAGHWANAHTADKLGFTRPIFYNPVYAVVRADDNRFDEDLSQANNPEIKIATGDRDIFYYLKKTDFPKAELVLKPPMVGETERLMMVKNNKADMTFFEPSHFRSFNEKNKGALKMIYMDKPLRQFASTIATSIDEPKLQSLLDTTLWSLIDDGTIERIFQKYLSDQYKQDFIDAPKSYE